MIVQQVANIIGSYKTGRYITLIIQQVVVRRIVVQQMVIQLAVVQQVVM
jgi:hypothetical protein